MAANVVYGIVKLRVRLRNARRARSVEPAVQEPTQAYPPDLSRVLRRPGEATVNQVISRRMVKKQQMRWSPRGAHLLLQVRTRVLNDDLAADFALWYTGLTVPDQQLVDAA